MPKTKKLITSGTKLRKTKKNLREFNSKRLDQLITNNDFRPLINKHLIYGIENPELVNYLQIVWDNLKRANPQNYRFSAPSITILFSAIAEVFLLQKDRITRFLQKQEILEERIKDYVAEIKLLLKNNDLMKTEMLTLKDGRTISVVPISTKAQILRLQRVTNTNRIKIRDLRAKMRAAEASKNLLMYEITASGDVKVDVTAHLLDKNERIIKLLKEFKLTPALAPFKPTGEVNEIPTTHKLLAEIGEDK